MGSDGRGACRRRADVGRRLIDEGPAGFSALNLLLHRRLPAAFAFRCRPYAAVDRVAHLYAPSVRIGIEQAECIEPPQGFVYLTGLAGVAALQAVQHLPDACVSGPHSLIVQMQRIGPHHYPLVGIIPVARPEAALRFYDIGRPTDFSHEMQFVLLIVF